MEDTQVVLAEVELSSLVLGHCLVLDRKMEVEIHQVEVDHFLDKDFLTGEEVENRASDRVEDILDNLVVLDLNNLGEVEMDLEVGESHHQVEMGLEVGESHTRRWTWRTGWAWWAWRTWWTGWPAEWG